MRQLSQPIEPLTGRPEFLTVGRWSHAGTSFEVASRRRLDTRQVIPYFVHEGVLHVGVLRRERASRLLRGAPALGLEPIGLDFSGVDETADILHYGRALFTERAHVDIDPDALKLPLPSQARSIGYLTELALPLLVGIRPPPSRVLDVSWDGGHHQVRFLPLDALLATLDSPEAGPHSEELSLLLRALRPSGATSLRFDVEEAPRARALLERHAQRLVSSGKLAERMQRPVAREGFQRLGEARGDELRFLRPHRVHHQGQWFEIVTPASGTTVAMLPFLRAGGTCYFLLWEEPRPAVLERHALQPLYELPLHPRHLNATACYVRPEEAERLAGSAREAALAELVPALLGRALGAPVTVRQLAVLGPAAEPAPSVSTELRHRVACELAPEVLEALPPDVLVISARELSRAIAEGLVRDPVIVDGLTRLGPALGVDPFADVRRGEVPRRLAFIDAMTEGSVVQRRLQGYSSIEREQLQAPTYARLMLLLQHEFGVRVAYPHSEADRSFFKAAFRVFMADGREENRALQGLHWSHDAFHFALGNYTPPSTEELAEWYVQGGPLPPEPPAEGPAFEDYAAALKAAEDEATFFSFWTLYHEQASLARHVGKLTFHEALLHLGITTRPEAREVFDAVTSRAELPASIREHPVYREREDVRSLFAYMLGFREYHLKDIRAAWRFAARDPYRSVYARFGIYEQDSRRYLAHVRGFQAKLEAQLPGLNPLKAACADTRVELALRVWDVIKALKLVRQAIGARSDLSESEARRLRAAFLATAEGFLEQLTLYRCELRILRSRVEHAELTARNEAVFAALMRLERESLPALRSALWDAVADTGLLDARTVAEERVRELPR